MSSNIKIVGEPLPTFLGRNVLKAAVMYCGVMTRIR